jgi:UDP-N-acetylglucosamine 2-epimerase (non-hydrolysing)
VLVITDSGGMQEETTFLDVPCLIARENIARPVTITMGTNQLVGGDLQKLRNVAAEILSQRLEGGTREYETNRERQPCRIPLGDGHAAERIAEIIARPGSSTRNSLTSELLSDRSRRNST